MIFVFGSNRAGRHGARYGIGEGRTGNAYAIPTKDEQLNVLPLTAIAMHVATFIEHARMTPQLEYEVTRIGCGLAGYADADIAPLFANAPTNCHLPLEWMPHE